MKVWIVTACLASVACGVTGKRSSHSDNANLLTLKTDSEKNSADACTYDTLGTLPAAKLSIDQIKCILDNHDTFLQTSLDEISILLRIPGQRNFFTGSTTDRGSASKVILSLGTAVGAVVILPAGALYEVAQVDRAEEGAPRILAVFWDSVFAAMMKTAAGIPGRGRDNAVVSVLAEASKGRAAMKTRLTEMLAVQTQDRDAAINPVGKFILGELYYFYLLSQGDPLLKDSVAKMQQNLFEITEKADTKLRVCLTENVWISNQALGSSTYRQFYEDLLFADRPSANLDKVSCSLNKRVNLGVGYKEAKAQANDMGGQDTFANSFQE